ncbi:hypothetical protein NQ317_012825 [Molorchus minor]|uniref:Uncharacterized protein n=1 Tax=Molorchus minor TaxID=1323400 RepID=A0ABQ9K583_9CUCU|nr:hypothetical protein NQ317_012825 [Molorchus minor]
MKRINSRLKLPMGALPVEFSRCSAVLTVIIGKQFFPRYYRLQVNPATPRERRVQAHLELAELVEDPRTLTCYGEIRHAIGFLLPRNRD